MARNQEPVDVSNIAWVQLTNSAVTDITFQVLSGEVYIRYTNGATIPAEEVGFIAATYDGPVNKALSELTVLAGADRVWARAVGRKALVIVDHA